MFKAARFLSKLPLENGVNIKTIYGRLEGNTDNRFSLLVSHREKRV
jgi:hypothetical protein